MQQNTIYEPMVYLNSYSLPSCLTTSIERSYFHLLRIILHCKAVEKPADALKQPC